MDLNGVRFTGEHFVEPGDDGKHYETFESYIRKCYRLGELIVDDIKAEVIPRPTKLLSIPRGSLIPTDIVSRMLDLTGDDVISLGLSFYRDTEKNKVPKIGQIPVPQLVEGEVVLVVDEVADSTETFTKVDELIMPMGPQRIIYATVIDKLMPDTRRPDYAAAHTDHSDRWVVFPNELFEAYGRSVFRSGE